MPSNDTPRYCIRIDPSLVSEIDALAQEAEVTRSALIRVVLTQYLHAANGHKRSEHLARLAYKAKDYNRPKGVKR